MSTSVLHNKADLQACPTLPHLRECIFNTASRNTQFSSSPRIHLQTSHTRARLSHIFRDESKSSHLQLLLELGLQSPRSDEPFKCKGLHSTPASGDKSYKRRCHTCRGKPR
ncbi:hypothetical protein ACFX2K_020101 [Malus domestica]